MRGEESRENFGVFPKRNPSIPLFMKLVYTLAGCWLLLSGPVSAQTPPSANAAANPSAKPDTLPLPVFKNARQFKLRRTETQSYESSALNQQSKTDSEPVSAYKSANLRTVGLSPQLLTRVFANDFSFVAIPTADNILVSQLQVDLTAPNITLAGFVTDFRGPKARENYPPVFRLSTLLKAGYSEGLATVFASDKLSPGVSASVQGNLDLLTLWNNIRKKSHVPYELDEADSRIFEQKFDSVAQKQVIDETALRGNLARLRYALSHKNAALTVKYQIEQATVAKTVKQLNATLDSLQRLSNPDTAKIQEVSGKITLTEDLAEDAKLKLEELRAGGAKTSVEATELERQLSPETLQKKRSAQWEEFLEKTEWTKQNYLWLTLEGDLKSKRYYLFDPKAPFDNQVIKEDFVGKSVGIRMNTLLLHRKKWFPNTYISLGFSRTYANNVESDGLPASDAARSEKYAYADTARSVSSKVTVYPFAKYETAWVNHTTLQVVQYLSFRKQVALDAILQREKREGEGPVRRNLGLGLIFLAQDKAKAQTKLNVELLVMFRDLANVQANTDVKEWHRRSEISLKVGLPFGLPR